MLADDSILKPDDLPFYMKVKKQDLKFKELNKKAGSDYHSQMEYAEKIILIGALKETNGNKTHAANRLGFSIRTMRNKTRKYGL